MMKFSFKFSGILLFALLNSAACGSKAFTTSSSGGGAQGNNNGFNPDEYNGSISQPCQNSLQQITTPVKMLFVVDVSLSNINVPSQNWIGSDPGKVMRGGVIQEFFNTYKAKTNFSWAFNVFSGATSRTLIGFSATQPAFTKLPSAMQNAISAFYNVADSGTTPYLPALDLATYALQQDAERETHTKWVVVFLSDGIPENPDETRPADQDIWAKVSSLVNTIPGQVTFNTVYYGRADANASGRLRTMASIGNGKFLDTNANPSGKTFRIEDVINVPGTACR